MFLLCWLAVFFLSYQYLINQLHFNGYSLERTIKTLLLKMVLKKSVFAIYFFRFHLLVS